MAVNQAPLDVNKSLDGCTYPGCKMSHSAYQKNIRLVQQAAGYRPGPVAPPITDGASLVATGKNEAEFVNWSEKFEPHQ